MSDYIPGSFETLQLEHELHEEPDPNCLWCNGRLSAFWRNVNQDED